MSFFESLSPCVFRLHFSQKTCHSRSSVSCWITQSQPLLELPLPLHKQESQLLLNHRLVSILFFLQGIIYVLEFFIPGFTCVSPCRLWVCFLSLSLETILGYSGVKKCLKKCLKLLDSHKLLWEPLSTKGKNMEQLWPFPGMAGRPKLPQERIDDSSKRSQKTPEQHPQNCRPHWPQLGFGSWLHHNKETGQKWPSW